MCGADVGARGHGGDVCGHGDEGAGGRSPRARWRNEHHDGHRRSKLSSDDVTGGLIEATRRIEFDNDEIGARGFGFANRTNDDVS